METRSKTKLKADTTAIKGLLALSNPPEKKSKSRVKSEFIPKYTDDFTRIQIWTDDAVHPIPTRVLCLDADDTLIDYAASKKAGKLIFANEKKLREKIKYAVENDITLAIVTSRIYEDDLSSEISIGRIVKELGIENFTWIYYTNRQDKSPVLEDLWHMYYKMDDEFQDRVALLDDLDDFLSDCAEEGFPIIRANCRDSNGKYLDTVQDYMEGKPIPIVRFIDKGPLLPRGKHQEEYKPKGARPS